MDRNKFLTKFKEEADIQLLQISQQLVDLERAPKDEELINSIFRVAHTLKGNAKMLSLAPISNLAHEFESIFSEIRDGKLTLYPEMTDLLFEALETLQGCVDASALESAEMPDIGAVTNRLSNLLARSSKTTDNPIPQFNERFKNEALAQLLKISQLLVELERSPEGQSIIQEIFRLAHTLKGNAAMLGFQSIKNVAHELEEIFMAARDRAFHLQPHMLDTLFEALDYLEQAVSRPSAKEDTLDLQDKLRRLLGRNEPEQPVEQVSPKNVPVSQALISTPASRVEASTLSVNVTKLDDLMNITGELVLGKMEAESVLEKLRIILELMRRRQRAGSLLRNITSSPDRDPNDIASIYEIRQSLVEVDQIDRQVEGILRSTFKEYEEHTNHLQNTVDELERNVLSIRMLPIGTLFEEFRPFVRNVARALGRQTPVFVVSGGEIELDKKVLEGIRDPLIHLVRNALDHGIELPDERIELGKSPEGRLSMDAIQESGYVYINISDDGAGIDPAKIRRKVVEKALLSESRALVTPDTEIINYIYEPGFSTSAIITDNSGRGVGMDVVKKNIERLGGQVSVTSESMVGTIFTLKVPLTIATSRALLVKVEEQTYAIPAPSIEQMLYLTPSDITTRAGRDVVMHGNALIPVIKLAELLGRNANREHPLFRWQTLNSVRAQDLNGRGLTTRLTNGNGNHPADSFLGLTLADPEARKQIIKIQTETPAKTSSRYSFERMPAVVVGSRERRFCLLVESLEDETEIVVKSLSSMLRVPHINSATILGDGRVVLILDVPNIIASARVMTSQNRLKASQSFDNKPTQKRILVVDDSITTRELEKSILEASGYHVDTADDGTVALDILLAGNSYDLLISDIEMPRMNGFELTALIKANPNLKQLPVIIVSSLNNDDQKRQGIKAGAQAYITKGDFNQNNLLSTIEYLTG